MSEVLGAARKNGNDVEGGTERSDTMGDDDWVDIVSGLILILILGPILLGLWWWMFKLVWGLH